MKNPLSWLLSLAVMILLISGIVFVSNATDRHIPSDARTPSMVGGIVCLVLACFLLVFGILIFRRPNEPIYPPRLPREAAYDDPHESRTDGIRPI